MLFPDGCPVLSEWEWDARLQKIENQYVANVDIVVHRHKQINVWETLP